MRKGAPQVVASSSLGYLQFAATVVASWIPGSESQYLWIYPLPTNVSRRYKESLELSVPRLVEFWQIQKIPMKRGTGEDKNEATEGTSPGKKEDETGGISMLRKELPRRRNTTKAVVN
jgi:hypothetical protein